jgi:hypothetical protein
VPIERDFDIASLAGQAMREKQIQRNHAAAEIIVMKNER